MRVMADKSIPVDLATTPLSLALFPCIYTYIHIWAFSFAIIFLYTVYGLIMIYIFNIQQTWKFYTQL